MLALEYLHGLSCWKQEVSANALFITHLREAQNLISAGLGYGVNLGPADFPNQGTSKEVKSAYRPPL
jgi:hypothetical protein